MALGSVQSIYDGLGDQGNFIYFLSVKGLGLLYTSHEMRLHLKPFKIVVE